MMKAVPVEEAVGRVLFHDITRIAPGEFKGRAFKKGHLIREEDVPKLLNLGKDNVYVMDLPSGFVHENDAAVRIAKGVAGPGIRLTEPVEGKVQMVSTVNGLLKINVDALLRINSIEQIVLASLHTDRQVTADLPVAGTRIIPLFVEEEKISQIEGICGEGEPVVQVKSFSHFKVGLITTGNEIFYGRIQDKFGPVIRDKFAGFGSEVVRQIFVPDNVQQTADAIRELIADGADMVVLTGGMSVDPDDRTPAGIRAAGADVVSYGSPTFPGAMFMLAYVGGIPVVGLPGCVMYHKATVFELIIPRILAGDKISRRDIVTLGHGGFCQSCTECRYPDCSFGKG